MILSPTVHSRLSFWEHFSPFYPGNLALHENHLHDIYVLQFSLSLALAYFFALLKHWLPYPIPCFPTHTMPAFSNVSICFCLVFLPLKHPILSLYLWLYLPGSPHYPFTAYSCSCFYNFIFFHQQ